MLEHLGFPQNNRTFSRNIMTVVQHNKSKLTFMNILFMQNLKNMQDCKSRS